MTQQSRTIAFFDLDGTLVSCYTQKLLASKLLESRVINHLDALVIGLWFGLYKIGLIRRTSSLRKIFYPCLARVSRGEMSAIFNSVVENALNDHVRDELVKIIQEYKSKGVYTCAVTATLDVMAEPICEHLDLDEIHSTRLEKTDGVYSGRWVGEVLEGPHKVAVMRLLAEKNHVQLQNCSAYADSYSDLEMLESVGRPVAVFPDAKLRAHALRKKWTIIE
ncbi:MAG: HAD-IB family hydrolase [Candidatus Omnitrophica bacterium]|jgi:HAD superfamily hydrolase (TIGR01490 family)|nr:HAD-IB family hydrolase [Candidatus Omnitrophota bacterium]